MQKPTIGKPGFFIFYFCPADTADGVGDRDRDRLRKDRSSPRLSGSKIGKIRRRSRSLIEITKIAISISIFDLFLPARSMRSSPSIVALCVPGTYHRCNVRYTMPRNVLRDRLDYSTAVCVALQLRSYAGDNGNAMFQSYLSRLFKKETG